MRTLKKTLALVLVLAMMFSLCVTASADFSDAEEIKYVEAVEVLTAIGVIEGMPDGTFDPTGTLTRAQAATILVRLLGAEDLAAASEATFTDVAADHWAADAIAYCYEQGIIDGYGDGKYGPSDPLKGYQWAKMLLVGVLGYDAEEEELTGTAWQVNTAKLATSVGLFAGNAKGDKTVAATREEACLYALNAAIDGADITTYYVVAADAVVEAGKAPATYIEKYASASDAYLMASAIDGKVHVVKSTTGSQLAAFGVERNPDAEDDFGRPGTSYTRAKAQGLIDLFYADSAAATVLVTGAANDTLAEIAKAEGLKTTDTATKYKVGQTVEVYADAKGNVIDTVVLTTELAQIAKVTKTTDKDATYTYSVSLQTAGGIKVYTDTALVGFDAETMVKDTYITLVKGGTTAIVAAADKVTGKMTAQGTGYVKIDGEKYSYSGTVWNAASSYTDTYDVYFDANDYVIGVAVAKAAEVAYDIFYISESKTVAATDSFGTTVAKIVATKLDGTSAMYDLALTVQAGTNYIMLDGEYKALVADMIADGFYAYTTNDAGEIASLTAIPNAAIKNTGVAESIDFTEKKANVVIGDATLYATTGTTVTVIDAAKAEAATITGYAKFDGTDYATTGDNAVTGILYTYDKDVLKAVYVMGGEITISELPVIGVLVGFGDEYVEKTVTYVEAIYNVAGTDTTFKVKKDGAEFYDFATITVTDGVAALADATVEDMAANKFVEKVTDTYIVIDDAPVYLADTVAYYDVTDVAKNGVVADDAVVAGDVINYVVDPTTKKIVAVYTVYAAKEDGVIEALADKTDPALVAYLEGKSNGAFEPDKITDRTTLIQYTRPEGTTSCTLKFWGETYTNVVTATLPTTAGTGLQCIDGGSYDEWAVDTYTYEIYCNGVVIQTGSFVL